MRQRRWSLSAVAFALSASVGGCYIDNTTDWSPAPPRQPDREPPPEPEPYASRVEQLPPEWSEQEKVMGLLVSYCGDCHGSDSCPPPRDCADAQYIDDLTRMIEEGKIIPGNPQESPIVTTMADGVMPPGYYDAPPELVARVSAFIASLCPPEMPECETEPDTAE